MKNQMKNQTNLNYYLKKRAIAIFLMIFIVSCSEDELNLEENDLSSIEYANKCNDCGDSSDGYFYFFKGIDASYSKIEKSKIDLSLIEKSLKSNEPIKIIYNEEGQIVNIKSLNKNELALYREKETIDPDFYDAAIDIDKETSSFRGPIGEQLETLNLWARAFSTMDHFNFDYATDGCYARAHQMMRHIKEKEQEQNAYYRFKFYKAWIYAKDGTKLTATTAAGCKISWRYHVAPMFILPDGTKWVLDPSLDPTKVLTYDQWVTLATSNQSAKVKRIYTDAVWYYYNETRPSSSVKDFNYIKSSCTMTQINYYKEDYPDCGGPIGHIPTEKYGYCWNL